MSGKFNHDYRLNMDKFPAKSNAFASYFAVIPSEVELSGLGSRDIDGKAGG
jgi:hypothetical protein